MLKFKLILHQNEHNGKKKKTLKLMLHFFSFDIVVTIYMTLRGINESH